MFLEVLIDSWTVLDRKQCNLRDTFNKSISNCILDFINNKWLQPSAQAWIVQLVNRSGLTWVIVLLPRSKIPKLTSESVSRGPWYGEIFTILKLVLSKAWGTRKPGTKMCNLTPRDVAGDERLESFSTLDSSRQSVKTFSFKRLKFPFDPCSKHWAEGRFTGYKCAGDLYSERGIRGEMKCLGCLGSGQQFTEALAAKKECLSFPDSDTGERIAATAGTRMLLHLLQAPPAESHSPPLSKTRHS